MRNGAKHPTLNEYIAIHDSKSVHKLLSLYNNPEKVTSVLDKVNKYYSTSLILYIGQLISKALLDKILFIAPNFISKKIQSRCTHTPNSRLM